MELPVFGLDDGNHQAKTGKNDEYIDHKSAVEQRFDEVEQQRRYLLATAVIHHFTAGMKENNRERSKPAKPIQKYKTIRYSLWVSPDMYSLE